MSEYLKLRPWLSNPSPDQYSCQKCPLTFRLKCRLDDHIFQCHSKHVCGYITTTVHTDEDPAFETQSACESFFESKAQLVQHRMTHEWTSDDGYVELYANAEFLASRAQHKKNITTPIHVNINKYKCDFKDCEFSCQLSNTLLEHRRAERHNIYVEKPCEDRISALLTLNNITFKPSHLVKFDQSFGTIDFVIVCHGHEVFLEIDEEQHTSYPITDEIKRMVRVFWARQKAADETGDKPLPIVFIRYNPSHCKSTTEDEKKIYTASREAQLLSLLTSPDSHIFTGNPFTIQYMYYMVDSVGDLVIHKNSLYDQNIARNHCLGNIFGDVVNFNFNFMRNGQFQVGQIGGQLVGMPKYTGLPPNTLDLVQGMHVCSQCNLSFAKLSYLALHISSCHGKFECGYVTDYKYKCELVFESKKEMKEHKRSHRKQ